jgi:hypothetical protein
VLHHGFEQGDALASDKKPSTGAPGKQAIDLSKQVTRHSVLPKIRPVPGVGIRDSNIIRVFPGVPFRILAWPRAPKPPPSKLFLRGVAKWTEGLGRHK